MNDNPHIGESFESFLRDEGICEEVTAEAVRRARRVKIEREREVGAVALNRLRVGRTR